MQQSAERAVSFSGICKQESHKYHEKRDYDHIILKKCVISIDFTLLLHYDVKENKMLGFERTRV